jgi:hypothetical protein
MAKVLYCQLKCKNYAVQLYLYHSTDYLEPVRNTLLPHSRPILI